MFFRHKYHRGQWVLGGNERGSGSVSEVPDRRAETLCENILFQIAGIEEINYGIYSHDILIPH